MITGVKFRRALHAVTMTYICIGMLYMYQLSDFSRTDYTRNLFYYVFAKSYDILLMACVVYPLKEVFWQWFVLGVFFVIRLSWEAFAIKDYATASRPSVIHLLFYCDVACILIITIFQIIKTKRW